MSNPLSERNFSRSDTVINQSFEHSVFFEKMYTTIDTLDIYQEILDKTLADDIIGLAATHKKKWRITGYGY